MPRSRGRTGRPWRRVREQVLDHCNICWLCGEWIDRSIPAPDPMSASVDHVVPLSEGEHVDPLDPAYLRPAHFGCNSSRGNRAPRPRLNTSRAW